MKSGRIKKIAAAAALMGTTAAGSVGIMNMQSAAPSQQQSSEIEQKDYTLLLYVIGSDLESDANGASGAASKDMQEIATAMKENSLDEKVNVVAEIGGTENWADESLSSVRDARITIDSSGITICESLENVNMGQGKTLTDFIDYGVENYPASHYLLIFWDHGNGPAEGYGYDTQYDGDSLTLAEIYNSIHNTSIQKFPDSVSTETSAQEAGQDDHKIFDLVGFDACNMGSIELANIFAEYADYVVASPAYEAIDGWDYSWMSVLAADDTQEKDIGKAIVDSYGAFYEDKDVVATLSCYDMSQYDKLCELLRDYNSSALINQDFDYQGFNSNRNLILGYYSGGVVNNYFELPDLKQLYMYLVETGNTESSETENKGNKDSELLEKLDAALTEFVAYTTVDTDGMCGISIYLPGTEDDNRGQHMYNYMNCLYDESYITFVYNYVETFDDYLDVELSLYDMNVNCNSVSFELSSEMSDAMMAAYVVTAFPMEDNEDLYYLLSTDSDGELVEDNTLSFTLDNQYMSIADELLCLMEVTDGADSTTYLSPILYNGELCMMSIEVSMDYPDGKICGIIPYTSEPSKEQYELSDGDSFAALYPMLDKTGEISFAETVNPDTYYQAEEKVLEDYDCELQLINVDSDDCVYELMIVDKNMGKHYLGF